MARICFSRRAGIGIRQCQDSSEYQTGRRRRESVRRHDKQRFLRFALVSSVTARHNR